VSEHFGGRAGLVMGGIACFVAAAGGWLVFRRMNASAARAARLQEAQSPENAPVAA
jgi:FtsP/CotA-like multicopper oxidase with cupredoxin domain